MLQIIRKKLGITRWQLACYLQSTSNMLKSVESGRRILPVRNASIYSHLISVVMEAEKVALASVAEPFSEKDQRTLERTLRKWNRKMEACMRKLEKMKQNHEKAMRCLQLYDALEAQPCSTITNKMVLVQRKLLSAVRGRMCSSMQQNCQVNQLMLSAMIESYKTFMSTLRTAMAANATS